MDAKLVSVVIPTKDRSAFLREALASVRKLEGPDLSIEIIVADNGSTDDTFSVVEEFGACLVHEPKHGASATRNAGLRAAHGKYIAFLDDDDRYTEHHLRPQIELLESRPDFTAAIGQVTNGDYELHDFSSPWPTNLPTNGNLLPSFFGFHPQIGATVFRASALPSIGFLDEDLRSDEDWDWQLRLAAHHKVGFVPVPCVLFRQRPSGTADELVWLRVNDFREVFFLNLKRIGLFRVFPLRLARSYWRHQGLITNEFCWSIVAHVDRGEREAGRRALWYALRTSALHLFVGAMRHKDLRRAILALLRPGSSGPRGVDADAVEKTQTSNNK